VKPLRWVLDTNCLVSTLVFESRHHARHARADAVVSGDGDLLAVRSEFDIPILAPGDARALLGKRFTD